MPGSETLISDIKSYLVLELAFQYRILTVCTCSATPTKAAP